MKVNPGDKESFLGAFLEACVYGYYLCLTPKVLVVLRQKSFLSGGRHFYVLFTFVALFVLITARCILDTVRCVVALQGDGNTVEFGSIAAPLGVTSNVMLLSVHALADTLLVWRTYLIWSRRWYIVLLPGLALLGSLITSVWLVYSVVNYDPSNYLFHALLAPFVLWAYLTLFQNVACTGLIAFKVMTTRHVEITSMYKGNDPLGRIVTVIVESAALYSCLVIAQAVTLVTHSFLLYVFVDVTVPIIGIVFSNILIRGGEAAKTVIHSSPGTSDDKDLVTTFEVASPSSGSYGRTSDSHDVEVARV